MRHSKHHPRRRWRVFVTTATALALALVGAAVAETRMASSATAGCRVDYTISSSWPGGFGANVTITNLGDPVNGWRLTWSFGAGQTITQLWNGSSTQSGSQVTVTNASYNGGIATGGTATFGFNDDGSGGSCRMWKLMMSMGLLALAKGRAPVSISYAIMPSA